MGCLIIAEVAQAHDGSLGMAHSFIDAVASTGADAVKFQTHIAEAESSDREPFRVKFSYEDATRFDYWKRMEFTRPQWEGLKEHCGRAGVEFLSSPFSLAAVDLLERIGMSRYKVGSGEVGNLLLLDRIARTGKGVILSSGMSSYAELDASVAFLRERAASLSILQCTTAYPTPPERVGLNVLAELRARYGVPVGLSDHSGTVFPALAAVALGASIIEVHVAFDKRMFGPDASSSLTFAELAQLVQGVRFLTKAISHPVAKDEVAAYGELKTMFGKSLAINKDLGVGHVLTVDDLESKKPAGCGLAASEYKRVLGRTLAVPKGRYEFLGEGDLA